MPVIYEPANAAPTEEVIETCRPLKEFDGLYCTHMRDEADGVMTSLEETFRIGREVGVQVVISHLKVVGEANRGRSAEALSFIEENMAQQRICMDCYPYTAGSTVLSADRAASSTRVNTAFATDCAPTWRTSTFVALRVSYRCPVCVGFITVCKPLS